MNFIRAFLVFWRGYRPAIQPEWSKADTIALASFMRSGTGRRLDATMRSQIAAANELAAMRATPFQCGWACGYKGLYVWFEALSAKPAAVESGQNEDDPFGE